MRSKKVLLATALVMASVAAGAPAPAMAQGVNWIHATIGALCERDGQSFFVNVYNVTTEPNSSSLWGRCCASFECEADGEGNTNAQFVSKDQYLKGICNVAHRCCQKDAC